MNLDPKRETFFCHASSSNRVKGADENDQKIAKKFGYEAAQKNQHTVS